MGACLKWVLLGLAVVGAPAMAGEPERKKPGPAKPTAEKKALGALGPAIMSGLDWLARHQDPDGHWSTAGFSARCRGEEKCTGKGTAAHDSGITALALLALLEGDHLPESTSPYAPTAKRALDWLKANQAANGCFPRPTGEYMYDHAIATLAMAEAARLTKDQEYHDSGQRGVAYLEKARNPGLAWRYEPHNGDNDTSVTAWCMQALAAAEAAKLKFDRTAAYQGVRAWLKKVTARNGVVGYVSPGDAGSFVLNVNDKFLCHPAMTSAALYMKVVMDKKSGDPWLKTAAAMLGKDLPLWDDEHHTIDFYYWHYGALAMCRFDGPKGPGWAAFRDAIVKSLIPNQRGKEDGCAGGSWDPQVDKWSPCAGRVYATAINVLTLELIEKMK
jgi:hypothetical protein